MSLIPWIVAGFIISILTQWLGIWTVVKVAYSILLIVFAACLAIPIGYLVVTQFLLR
jgi:hypothetical protein